MNGAADSRDGDDHLEVRTEARGPIAVVWVLGEVDMVSGAAFAAALRTAVQDAEHAVEVDLRGVTYLGSEGVQTLVRSESLARGRGVALSVTPSPIVARCLEVSGLSDLITAAP